MYTEGRLLPLKLKLHLVSFTDQRLFFNENILRVAY